MARLYDLCECPCHQGSVTSKEPPEVSDPVAALTACSRCAVLHVGVWTVVDRPTEGNTNSEGDE